VQAEGFVLKQNTTRWMEKKGTMVPAAATAASFPRLEWERLLLIARPRSARGSGTFREGVELFVQLGRLGNVLSWKV
jgi:hypothetical protein